MIERVEMFEIDVLESNDVVTFCFHCYRFTDFFIDIDVLTRHATGTNYRTSTAEK